MRLYEILNEAISLTHLLRPLEKALMDSLADVAHETSKFRIRVDPEIRDEVVRKVSLSPLSEQIKTWMFNISTHKIPQAIKVVLDKHVDADIKVEARTITSSGFADGNLIVINQELFRPLTEYIFNTVYQNALDNLESEIELFHEFFSQMKTLSTEELENDKYRIYSNIFNIISVIIHEVVHVMQYKPQSDKGRENTEYRSYLTKDKEKFFGAIDKVSKGDIEPAAYRLYRSSPQEIAAFAHEEALKIVNNLELDQIDDFPHLRNEINQDIQWYINDQFSDPENPEEYKIFKRFHKLMYQEVIRAIDRAEKEFKKRKSITPKNINARVR